MSTKDFNLDTQQLPNGKGLKIAILTAEWNSEITFAMRKAAKQTLLDAGTLSHDIYTLTVPGSYELIYGSDYLFRTYPDLDAVICLGCVIQGETPHFTYICEALSNALPQISLKYSKPVIFGVLTTGSKAQAEDRAGGRYGNKGAEAAVAALKMATPNLSVSIG